MAKQEKENNTTTFEMGFIQESITQTEFEDKPAQKFFIEWCKMNDHISPKFITRSAWNRKKRDGKSIIESTKGGNEKLIHIPKDIHLWEMKEIIEALDNDTFSDNSEQQSKGIEKLEKLGETFKQAGIYLKQYLGIINNGQDIAKKIAKEFYDYGLSLEAGEHITDQDIPDEELSFAEMKELDEWFLGTNSYQRRLKRMGNKASNEKWLEKRRVKIIQLYFKALSKKAYYNSSLETKLNDTDDDKKDKFNEDSIDKTKKPWELGYLKDIPTDDQRPWERKIGPIAKLHNTTLIAIQRSISQPSQELNQSIFKRGVELLAHEIPSPPTALLQHEKKLYDALDVKKLTQQLKEIRETKKIDKVVEMELKITKEIQEALSFYPYFDHTDNTTDILEENALNCLGSAILAGRLLAEIGIKFSSVHYPSHSLLFVLTSDNKVHWRDFTPESGILKNREVLDSDILSKEQSISKIIKFINNPHSSGINLLVNDLFGAQTEIIVKDPELDLTSSTLSNEGNRLFGKRKFAQAAEMYRHAFTIDPNFTYPLIGLADCLVELAIISEKEANKHMKLASVDFQLTYPLSKLINALSEIKDKDENVTKAIEHVMRVSDNYTLAIEVVMKAIELNPKPYSNMKFLGTILLDIGQTKEAILTFQKMISMNPNDPLGYEWLLKSLEKIGDKEGHNQVKKLHQKLSGLDNSTYSTMIDDAPKYFDIFNNAIALAASNKYQEALEKAQSVLKGLPDHHPTFALIGRCYLKLQNPKKAIEAFNESIRLNPSHGFVYETYKQLALAYVELGHYQEAKETFESILNGPFPEYFHEELPYAKALFELGELEEALKFYKIEYDKDFFPVNITLKIVKTLSALGRYSEAEDTLIHAHTKNMFDKAYETDDNYYVEYGRVLLKLNKYSEAKVKLIKAIEINPNNKDALKTIGKLSYLEGKEHSDLQRHQFAIDSFEQAIKYDPQNPNIYAELGNSYLQMGEYKKAESTIRKAVEHGYDKQLANELLVTIHTESQNFGAAIKLAKEKIQRRPKNAEAHITLGDIYLELGNFDKAYKTFYPATQLGQNAAARAGLGEAMVGKGDSETAVGQFKLASEYDPTEPKYQRRRAEILYDLGRYQEAVENFNASIKINDKNPKSYSGLGDAYFRLENYEMAMDSFSRAIELDPTNTQNINWLGNSLFMQGRYKDAMEIQKKATVNDPNVAIYHSDLGDAYAHEGLPEPAIKSYKKAIELDKNEAQAYLGLAEVYTTQNRTEDTVQTLKDLLLLPNLNKDIQKEAQQQLKETNKK